MDIQPPEKSTLNTSWKILVIDDDEDDYILVSEMLQEAKGRKIVCHWAATYEAGQAELAGEPYNAVLVDYDLGVRKGIELICEAEALGYPSPLILFTGRGGYAVDLEAMQAGATLYITKDEANPLLLERVIRYAIEMKQKEALLRENENRIAAEKEWFRTTLSSIGDAVITCDPQGKVTFLNPVAEQLTGWTNGEAAGQPVETVFDIINEQTHQPAEIPVKKTLQNGHVVALANHTALIARNGQVIAIEDSASPIHDAAGQIVGVVMIFHDVTERRKALEQVRYQASLLAQVQDAVLASDEMWRITYWNKMAEAVFGWSEEEALGKTVQELLESQFPNSSREQAMKELIETGHYEGEVIYRRKDGTCITASAQVATVMGSEGELIGFVASMRDITERKRAEEQLRASEAMERKQREFLECLIANAGACIAVLQGRELRYTLANPAFQTFAGGEPMVGRTYREVFPEAAQAGAEALMQRVLETGETWKVGSYQAAVPGIPDATWEGQVVRLPVVAGEEPSALAIVWNITELKRAEEALQGNEAKMRAILQSLSEGIVFLNTDGIVEEINRSVQQNFGHTLNELVDPELDPRGRIVQSDGSLFPVEEQPAMVALRTGKAVHNVELGVPTSNGEISWRLVNAEPVFDDQGTTIGAVTSLHDITERKQAEQALRVSEEQFRSILESSRDVIYRVNMQTGCYDYVSPSCEQIVGFTVEEMMAQDARAALEMIHPDDREAMQTAMARLETSDTVEVEYRQRTKKGNYRWMSNRLSVSRDKSGHPVYRNGNIHDITERRQAEERLTYQAQLLEMIHDAIIATDQQMKITYWNQAAERLYGWTSQEALGQNATQLLRSELAGSQRERVLQQMFESGVFAGEIIHHTKDGHRLVVEVRTMIQKDASGQLIGYLTANRDITDRRQAEEDLQRSHEALRFSEEKFSKAFQFNPAAMSITRASDARYLDANESFCKITGYSREELIGHTSVELGLYSEEARQAVIRLYREAGNVRQREFSLASRNGQQYTVLFSMDPIKVNGEPCNLATLVDITERKRIEEAKRESEMIYRAIGEAIDYGIWICDRDGRNIYASQSYLDLVGITQEQCSKFGWGDTLHPDDAERTIAAWKECARTGSFWNIEHRFLGKDGQYHPILARGVPIRNEKGEIIYWAGINLDISDLKAAEQARLTSQVQIELQRRLMEQREEERQAIARELHDGPVQDLSGMLFNIQFTKEAFSDLALQVELENIGNGLRKTIQEIRDMINELRPPSLIRFGLSKTIQVYLEEFQNRHPEILVYQSIMDDESRLSEPARFSLYRILQEALSNVVKHSNARRLDVVLECEEKQVILEIHDDGQGFSVPEGLGVYSAKEHYGLVGMQERADAVKAEFQVDSSPGKGTTIRVLVPTKNT